MREERVLRDEGEETGCEGRFRVVGDEVHLAALSVDRGEGLLDERVVVSCGQFGVGEERARDS